MTFSFDVDPASILVECPRSYSYLVSEIPGAKKKGEFWRLPKRYSSYRMMLAQLTPGTPVGYTPRFDDWLAAEREGLNLLTQSKEIAGGIDLLRPHQVAQLEWMAHTSVRSTGGLVTAGLGSGKTYTSVFHLKRYSSSTEPALVICPSSLRHHWRAECNRLFPGMEVAIVEGSAAQRRKTLAREDVQVFIINYEAVPSHSCLAAYGSLKRSDKEQLPKELNKRVWSVVLLDEAHRIKNPKAKQTRAVWAVGDTARSRFALTATPISNNAGDVWSVFRFLQPDLFPGRGKYLDMFADVVENYFGYTEIRGFRKDKHDLFNEIIDPFHFTVPTDQVVDLPPAMLHTRYVELAPKTRKQYKMLHDKRMLQVTDMPPLPVTEQIVRQTRLQQIAQGSPLEMDDDGEIYQDFRKNVKIAELMDLLDAIPPDEKVVVFSLSKDLVWEAAMEHARRGSADFVLLTGDTNPVERQMLVDIFQENPDVRVFFATLAAASEGITLTAANHLVFLQRSYSLVQNLQAEGRIQRIGQDADTVHIYDIICKDTVDEEPLKALAEKAGRLDQFLNHGENK